MILQVGGVFFKSWSNHLWPCCLNGLCGLRKCDRSTSWGPECTVPVQVDPSISAGSLVRVELQKCRQAGTCKGGFPPKKRFFFCRVKSFHKTLISGFFITPVTIYRGEIAPLLTIGSGPTLFGITRFSNMNDEHPWSIRWGLSTS